VGSHVKPFCFGGTFCECSATHKFRHRYKAKGQHASNLQGHMASLHEEKVLHTTSRKGKSQVASSNKGYPRWAPGHWGHQSASALCDYRRLPASGFLPLGYAYHGWIIHLHSGEVFLVRGILPSNWILRCSEHSPLLGDQEFASDTQTTLVVGSKLGRCSKHGRMQESSWGFAPLKFIA